MRARESGLLKGNGVRRYRKKRRKFPDVHLSDHTVLRKLPDFDPNATYSQRELMLLTEKILIEDSKPSTEEPVWLHAGQYLDRVKKEVYVNTGIPDASIVSGLYWRTHPEGRKFWSFGDRLNKADRGFYR